MESRESVQDPRPNAPELSLHNGPTPESLGSVGALARLAWAGLGIGFVSLGAVGVVVPGLPTTPFLLLAAACFARGSKRLEAWLVSNRMFGPLISDYRTHRVVPRKTKALALTMMWTCVAYAVGPGMPAGRVWPRVVVLVAAFLGTAYLLSLRSKRAELAGH